MSDEFDPDEFVDYDDMIHHYGRQQGKSQALREAVAKAEGIIRDIRLDGWMKPWSIWIDGKRIQVVSPEDCENHEQRQRK